MLKFIAFNESPLKGHLWYLGAILYVLIIMHIFDKLKIEKCLVFAAPFLLMGDLILGKYSVLLLGREFPYILVRNFLFVGIPYFCIGRLIRNGFGQKVKKKVLAIFLIVFSATSLLERFALVSLNVNSARDHYISTTLLAITVFLFTLQCHGSNKTLALIGRKYSTWLYILHALLIGLILILILKKSKINDTWIMLIGVVFFIAGIFVQKQLDVASVNGYAGFWKLYYMIWGKTIKNGVFMGMFYCMLGTLIQKIPQTKTVFICTISAFILYVVGVYFQYEWRKLLLPVVLVLVVESVIMLPLHIGSLGKWFRSMSTLLFLCHYIFVRAFECFPTLAVCFPEGIHKFMFVGVSAFLLSALLVWAGNKNKRIRWLWQ